MFPLHGDQAQGDFQQDKRLVSQLTPLHRTHWYLPQQAGAPVPQVGKEISGTKGEVPPEGLGRRRRDRGMWLEKDRDSGCCQLPSKAANLSAFVHQTPNDPCRL